MEKIIFATSNQGKLKEIKMIMKDMPFEIIGMKEAGIEIDIEETGKTFQENAIIKATAISKLTGLKALADDSGLEVDALNKEPGVYSARYLGENTSYEIKNQYIIDRLKNVSGAQRSARYVCAIALSLPNGDVITKEATIEGSISEVAKGKNGFGYDPIFFVTEFSCTSAEMELEEKNRISHRGKALEEIKKVLWSYR